MAAPNILAATSITGKTVVAQLTTSSSQILTCPSDKVLKINSIILCFDGANGSESTVNTTVKVYDSSSGASRAVAGQLPIPNKTTVIAIGKDSPIFLEESDRIDGFAASSNRIDVVISYEELDDA